MKLADAISLVAQMKSRRNPREAQWRELSRWIYPARGRFDGSAFDRMDDAGQMILFTHAASQATLRGASGMTSGMTPKNASWFKPTFADEAMLEATGARIWLDRIDIAMKDCLANGGFYQAIHAFNLDLLWAGCGLLYSEKADNNPLQFEAIQIGSFCVETDQRGRLLAVARRMAFTADELAREFGRGAISSQTASALSKNPWQRIFVWHLTRLEDGGKFSVSSRFWEEGGRQFLRESGYNEMPFFFTSWHEGETCYGLGPGDDALPDSIQMDTLERRKLEGIAKITDPPVYAPAELKGTLQLGPGAMNFTNAAQPIGPAINMQPFAAFFGNLRDEIALVGQRLEQSLYAAIFASMPLDQRPAGMSATEFLERKREALQQLGPVISAYEPNVLTPLLYRVMQTLDRGGQLPPGPQSLRGNAILRVEFISPMANALRQTNAETTRALFQDVATMANATKNTALLDKIDMDQMVDELATALGCPGSVVKSDEDVAQIRQARAQAQQQQAEMQAQMQQAQIAAQGAQALNQGAQAAATAQEVEQASGGESASIFGWGG